MTDIGSVQTPLGSGVLGGTSITLTYAPSPLSRPKTLNTMCHVSMVPRLGPNTHVKIEKNMYFKKMTLTTLKVQYVSA